MDKSVGDKRKLEGISNDGGKMQNPDTVNTTTLANILKIVNSPRVNLGSGATGWATRVFMDDGSNLVMKSVDICQCPVSLEELVDECVAYDVLRTLQGEVIPRLVCYPFWSVKVCNIHDNNNKFSLNE